MRKLVLSIIGSFFVLALHLSVTGGALPAAHAASVDYFLKIDGIEGESTDDRHRNEIDVLSWSWGEIAPGLSMQSTAAGRGGGAGKVNVQDFSFTKILDKATPILMLSTATGQHYPTATLTVRKSGGDRQGYFMVKFSDVLISSYQVGGSADTVPMDTFSLNFSKIEFEYVPQNPDGSAGAPVKAGYDLKANKKV